MYKVFKKILPLMANKKLKRYLKKGLFLVLQKNENEETGNPTFFTVFFSQLCSS
jgi:hypothetical protein